ncbi:hypothetical protein GCM10008932_15320 [Alkalibacterium iburiense]|uniref:Oxidoreductase n=1 Tax=Alkalibacterium iburiense TaxID=290589 RepID=A0ABP3H7D0_9LACT
MSKEEDVDQIVTKAIESFGGFDTWVNNASVALYGHAEDIPIEEARQLFDINFWGAVYGMKKAVAHFKDRGEPGVVINIGSVAGNRTFPVQSFYSASKFALHGLTDGMRMELEKSGAPVVISQIHPARVDTPYTNHATSYIDRHPTHKGMVYPPESVAEAILFVAENPKRDVYVGTQSKYFSVMGRVFPRLIDRYMEWDTYSTNFDERRSAKSPEEGNLYRSRNGLMERGNNLGWHRPESLMVKAKKKPGLTTVILAGSALGLFKLMKKK